MNPNTLSESGMFLGGRSYPVPTIAMLKSILGSKAIVAKLDAARVRVSRPNNRRGRGENIRGKEVGGLGSAKRERSPVTA